MTETTTAASRSPNSRTAHANGTLRGPGGGHFGRHPHGPPDPARFVEHFDRNGNGTVELSELPPRLSARISDADVNHDGVLSADEIRAHMAEHQPGPDAPSAPDAPDGLTPSRCDRC